MHVLNSLIIGLLLRGVWGQTVDESATEGGDVVSQQIPAPNVSVTAPTQQDAPVEPTVPTVPTAPSEPATPTQPTVPTEPTQETTLTEPTEIPVPSVPTEPTEQTEQTESTETLESPTLPEPIQPTPPTEPTDSIETAESSLPTEMTEPTAPDDLATPSQLEQPNNATESGTDSVQPTESLAEPSSEPTQSSESETDGFPTAEPTEVTTDTELGQSDEPIVSATESVQPSETGDAQESAPTGPVAEPSEQTEAVDQPTESSESIEPAASIQPPEPTESPVQTESVEAPTQSAPASESAQPTDQGEPTDASEAVQPTQDIEPSQSDVPAPPSDVEGSSASETEQGSAGPVNTQAPSGDSNEPSGIPDQTQSSPSGFTTVTVPPSEPSGEVVRLDLTEASLGPGATFTTIAGKEAIVLQAPPNSEAKFTLEVKEPLDIVEDSLVNIRVSVKVEELDPNNRRKRFLFERATGTRLQLIMNEKKIYDKQVKTTDGRFREIKSEKTRFVKNPMIEVLQRAGSNPVAVTVRGLSFVGSSTETRRPNVPVVVSRTEVLPGTREESPVPADEPTVKPEEPTVQPEEPTMQPEEPTIEPEQSTAQPEEPAVPSEDTGQVSVPGNQETTVPRVPGTESIRVPQETKAPSATAGGGADEESTNMPSLSNLQPETGIGTATGVPGIGNPPMSTPTSTPGPVQIRPNEAHHDAMVNMVVLYGIPLAAAILV
ncbi:hypothetical protein FPSE_09565 [Fusarium pseudograminearum CS3096]|uniref:Zonadhesin n=1 Tax=Fusarium pseudograminearum (strain CS3096) TaxID=1028729 RepID=K3VD58_FUSPC|nr:hypothetical protein FPSE_09565 [Fusarium pseudograminearum CS3096]EKJ70348.1 hypothetical protein FPSE_09565 [Fusarium pseudograminearum CS3096]